MSSNEANKKGKEAFSMRIYGKSEDGIMETARLYLRAMEASDLKDLQAIWGDSEVMKYCGGALSGTHRLTRSIQYYETVEAIAGISAYAVILKESEEMIGVCGFNSSEEVGVYELVYHFKLSKWGNGYATEACKGVINYIQTSRTRCMVNKLIASVAPENNRSKRVLEKCGFDYTGDQWFDDTQRYEPHYELKISQEGCELSD